MDTKQIGNIAELEVQTYMTKLGVQVSVPYGDRARYDQIWDVNGKLLRVQIKHANVKDGFFEVKCASFVQRRGKRVKLRYTVDEIDGLATFFDGRVYYIPVNNASNTIKTLRFKTPSNITPTINWAVDYEVEKQLNLI